MSGSINDVLTRPFTEDVKGLLKIYFISTTSVEGRIKTTVDG